jgi:hypothetical protein
MTKTDANLLVNQIKSSVWVFLKKGSISLHQSILNFCIYFNALEYRCICEDDRFSGEGQKSMWDKRFNHFI